MRKLKIMLRPIYVLFFTVACLGTSLYLYIDSYLKIQNAFRDFVIKNKLDQQQLLDTEAWIIVLVLSVLVAIILAGLGIIYVYYQKMIQLYRLQQNFINGFTHELKTPIASLKIFIDTMMRHELKREDQLKYFEYMKRDANRLADNVEQILNLARLEERDYHGEFVRSDLKKEVEYFFEKTPHLFENGDMSFEARGEFFFSTIDQRLFEMLLMNLLTNAFRYNESVLPRVKVILSADDKGNVLEIIDNGIGIEKVEQRKIFKKFYQVGKSVKGSGIGLYLASQIVKIHRGSMKVSSDGEGKGSVFTVWLPRVV